VVTYTISEVPAGSKQFCSRPETREEQAETARAARLAFVQVGCGPVRCRVDFFGSDRARVVFQEGPLNGRAVWVNL